MATWMRRLFWLAMLSGAGFAVWTAIQRRNEPALVPQPTGPGPVPQATRFAPLGDVSETPADEPAKPVAARPEPAPPAPEQPPDQRWVLPVDGACPDRYPIKANARSRIYHVPGGRSYDRTVPERCYANTEDAEADGYRRAKA